MRKLVVIIFLILFSFLFSPIVFASTITWQQITDEWRLVLGNDSGNASFEADSFRFESSRLNTAYVINFSYDDSKVAFLPRNKEGLSDRVRGEFSLLDAIFVNNMLAVVGKLYDVDVKKLDFTKLNNYGIVLRTSEFEYTDSLNEVERLINCEEILEFSIDLELFDQGTEALKGTYSSVNEVSIDLAVIDARLTLKDQHETSLDLIVNVDYLNSVSNAKCDIYLVPDEKTAFASGDARIVATIDNCINGDNSITVDGLKKGSTYTFQVVLTEKAILNNINRILVKEDLTFSTVGDIPLTKSSIDTVTIGASDNNAPKEVKLNNPDTGNSFVYIILGVLVFSLLVLSLTIYRKTKLSDII